MPKSPDAFRTISEVAEWLGIQAHVLRFWESKFTQIKPVKRAGGRRYYRPADMQLIGGIKKLHHDDGLSIKDVQQILKEQGVAHVAALSPPLEDNEEPEPQQAPARPAAAPVAAAASADAQEQLHAEGYDTALPEASEVLSALNGITDDSDEDDTGEAPAEPADNAPPPASPAAEPMTGPAAATAEPDADQLVLEPPAETQEAPLQAQLDLSTPNPEPEPEPDSSAPDTLVEDVLAAEPDSPAADLLDTVPMPEPAPAAVEPEAAAPAEAVREEPQLAAGVGLAPQQSLGSGPGELPAPAGAHLLARLPKISHIPAPVRDEVEACAAELRAWLKRH